MALRHYATSVTTTATLLEGTQYPGWLLRNVGTATVYLGGDSSVTTSTGFPVDATEVFSPSDLSQRQLTGKAGERLYGIAASGTHSVRVLIPGQVRA